MINNKFSNFCNSYFKTNLSAIIIFVLILISAIIIDYFFNKYKKITTKKITIAASFISIIVIMNTATIWISKTIWPLGTFEIRLGDVMELLPGMILGPTMGIICAICADTLTIFTTANTGVYHFGFALEAALTGFMGSLIFLLPKNKLWILWTILLYSITFVLQEFIITPISLSSLYPGYYNKIVLSSFWILALISSSIKIPVYLAIFIPLFIVSYNYTNKFFQSEIWPNRKTELVIFQKNNISPKTDNIFDNINNI